MSDILIVDDELKIRELVKKYALYEGHNIEEAENGLVAVKKCRQQSFDIVIMDIMMPELDGFSAAREIRKFSDVPILMLSARGEEYDRINGFETGADDYVVKPFSPKELMLRVDAIIKRSQNSSSDNKDIKKYGRLTLDYTARIVYIDDQKIELSPKEYEILFYMAKNEGRALTREMLLSNIWGYDYFGDDRTLDTHIKLLRKKMGECSDYIVTLRGLGYRFEVK